jgi:hypothetical protein
MTRSSSAQLFECKLIFFSVNGSKVGHEAKKMCSCAKYWISIEIQTLKHFVYFKTKINAIRTNRETKNTRTFNSLVYMCSLKIRKFYVLVKLEKKTSNNLFLT